MKEKEVEEEEELEAEEEEVMEGELLGRSTVLLTQVYSDNQ